MILQQESMFSSDYPDSNCAQVQVQKPTPTAAFYGSTGGAAAKKCQTELNHDVIVIYCDAIMRPNDKPHDTNYTVSVSPVFSGCF